MEGGSKIILINSEWYLPFEGQPAEEQLEIRRVTETYIETGRVSEIVLPAVRIAFFYIKREIDAMKKRSSVKSEKQRQAAIETNRKRAAKKRLESDASDAKRPKREDADNSACYDAKNAPSEDASDALNIIYKNKDNIYTTNVVESTHASPERVFTLSDVISKFNEENPVLVDGYRKNLNGISKEEFAALMGRVLILWQGAGWDPGPITKGTHQFSAKSLFNWMKNEHDKIIQNQTSNADSRPEHLKRHIASDSYEERQRDVMEYVANNLGKD